VRFVVPEDEWEDTGDGRLLVTIYINGTPMHLEAIEVEVSEPPDEYHRGEQMAKDPLMESYFDGLFDACEPDGYFHETVIRGRRYVLFAQPYSQ